MAQASRCVCPRLTGFSLRFTEFNFRITEFNFRFMKFNSIFVKLSLLMINVSFPALSTPKEMKGTHSDTILPQNSEISVKKDKKQRKMAKSRKNNCIFAS